MILCNRARTAELAALLVPAHIVVVEHDRRERLPGSYWGEPEAGIRLVTSAADVEAPGRPTVALHVSSATPLHSALHEAAHVVCMDTARRSRVDTDAFGDDLEECAVCYLQILWAQRFDGIDLATACRDMDEWGYSFRLGSALRWFRDDAKDARRWLFEHAVVTQIAPLSWQLRA